MHIIERSFNSVSIIPLSTKLLEEGHIFIEESITDELIGSIKAQLMYLLNKSETAPIYIHINSPGGSINAGLMLYDIIQSYPDRIYTVCTGHACSMAAVLTACAKKGHRYILPNSEVMIHEPLIGNGIGGNCTSIKATSERLIAAKERINAILAKHTGKTQDEIDDATAYDNFLSAEESIEFGLCDKIIKFSEIMGGN